MPIPTRYESPYHWWGPGPSPSAPLTLRDLLLNRTVDIERAATLWAALTQQRSLTVIGGPSGLGKSTLLHALLPALPVGTQRYYLRGCFETFAFQAEPRLPAAASALRVNEISPHLPIYLWGPAVQRTLAAGEAGYQILATAHGRSATEFAASLTGSPLRIPARMLGALKLIVLLEPIPQGAGRTVRDLWQLSAARNGVSIDHLLPGDIPEGLTPGNVAAAREAVHLLLTQEPVTTDAASSGHGPGDYRPPPAHSGSDLEQTSAGE